MTRPFWLAIRGTAYRVLADTDTGAIERVDEWDAQRLHLIERAWDALGREMHYEITSRVLSALEGMHDEARVRDLGDSEGAVK